MRLLNDAGEPVGVVVARQAAQRRRRRRRPGPQRVPGRGRDRPRRRVPPRPRPRPRRSAARLTRLRAAALRVAEEGTDAPAPRDDGRDEVGDLARTLAAMQAALRRQEEARRAFVATASHELRTPLTSLSGTLELLREDLQDERLRPRRRRRAGRRRPGPAAAPDAPGDRAAGPQPPRRRPCRCAPSRSSSASCAAPSPPSSSCARAAGRIDLDVPPPPGPCWGRGDPDAVARVVRILVDNALRYAPAAHAGRRAPDYHGDDAHVTVTDHGPGVRGEDRERIFERFERGSAPVGRGRLRPRPGDRPRARRAHGRPPRPRPRATARARRSCSRCRSSCPAARAPRTTSRRGPSRG